MNTYLSKTVAWVMFTSFFLLLSGCSKNIINIDLGNEPDDSTSGSGTNGGGMQNALVTFNASVESRNMTRALSPMAKGVASLVYAYKSPFESLDDPTEQGLYVTTSAGVMAGVRDYKMHLPGGVYTFYAVSNNSYSTPPQFTDGVSHALVNGVDYLWANNKLQDISGQQVNIPFTYFHSATQVVFEVSGAPGLNLNKLISATITPGTPGATMSLINGDITPATSYSLPVKMGINGFLTQYTLLPLKTTTPMQLVLTILVNSEPAPRTYTVSVPVPNGELKSGNSYLFSALIDENAVSFSDANIVSWTHVDETGNPLYPTMKQ